MFRKVLILTAIISVFAASNLQAAQIPISWDGGGDGSTWADANNWDPNIVPDNDGNTFAVTIDSNSLGLDEIEVGLQQSRTIDKLDCYGHVDLDNWTSGSDDYVRLTIIEPNGLTNYGDLRSDDLSCIQGNVTNIAGANLELWHKYYMAIDGNLYNGAGARMAIDAVLDVEEDFINDGAVFVPSLKILWVDGGKFINNGNIRLWNTMTGISSPNDGLVNSGTGKIWGSGIISSERTINNSGSVIASSGTLLIRSGEGIINTGRLENNVGSSLHLETGTTDVNNLGTIIVNANGSVTFKSEKLFTEPNACTLNNEPNGVIKLSGGTLSATTITQSADANFTGFGGITGDVFIDPNGIIKLTGPTNIVGDVNVAAGATLEISDGQTLITGQTVNNGTIRLIGGTVIFQGGYSGSGAIINEAGIDRNHFDINADGIENFEDFAYFADTWLWQASWY